jgi:hypothetical protein
MVIGIKGMIPADSKATIETLHLGVTRVLSKDTFRSFAHLKQLKSLHILPIPVAEVELEITQDDVRRVLESNDSIVELAFERRYGRYFENAPNNFRCDHRNLKMLQANRCFASYKETKEKGRSQMAPAVLPRVLASVNCKASFIYFILRKETNIAVGSISKSDQVAFITQRIHAVRDAV